MPPRRVLIKLSIWLYHLSIPLSHPLTHSHPTTPSHPFLVFHTHTLVHKTLESNVSLLESLYYNINIIYLYNIGNQSYYSARAVQIENRAKKCIPRGHRRHTRRRVLCKCQHGEHVVGIYSFKPSTKLPTYKPTRYWYNGLILYAYFWKGEERGRRVGDSYDDRSRHRDDVYI